MRYLPHTREDISEMLQTIGVNSIDDLFSCIPQDCRREKDIQLPDAMSEWELLEHLNGMAETVTAGTGAKVFVGAGSYDHYIPSSIQYLLGRSEFSTSYTPYQPELSQGTLQAVFEYQTLVSRLLGMDVANASMYDGSTAFAEALLMAIRATRKKKVAVSRAVHPYYRDVAKTYFKSAGYEIVELPWKEDGTTDLSGADQSGDLAAIAIQSPNFFGCIEEIQAAADKAHNLKALLVTAFTEALSWGLLKNPGSQGADIVCGEGQSFGIPRSFGGPGLGMFASNKKYVRNMPGRLIGQTTDADGKRGYVLTLATREQHIRRDRATSNICTNSGLCALNATMYMASLGKTGIRNLARLNYDKAEYLKRELGKAGYTTRFSTPTFNEFVVECPGDFSAVHKKLQDKGIVAGISLETWYPELAGCYLMCVTETSSKADMDALVREVIS